METTILTVNNVWMMICTALVFFMHLGFSFLEIGLTRQKNTINILFKNFFVITVGLLLYCIGGFNLMYPGFEDGDMGILKFAGLGIAAPEGGMGFGYADGGYTWWTDFLFQGMFAATAATIVSGAVAERIKLSGFMLFSILYVGLVYPIVGSWKWGGGFLDALGFYDFAGSTLVHSVGGWGALVVIYFLGARKGKFDKDGKPLAIIGSNISEELFQGVDPLGKNIIFMGKMVSVIGVFEKVGESIIGESDDDKIIVPVKFALNFMRLNRESSSPKFLVKAKLGYSNSQLKGDLTRVMRSLRRLSPKADDNFALNEVSILSKGIDSLFSVIDLAGIVIGGFLPLLAVPFLEKYVTKSRYHTVVGDHEDLKKDLKKKHR